MYRPLLKDGGLHHPVMWRGTCPHDQVDLAADTSVDRLGTWHGSEGTRSVTWECRIETPPQLDTSKKERQCYIIFTHAVGSFAEVRGQFVVELLLLKSGRLRVGITAIAAQQKIQASCSGYAKPNCGLRRWVCERCPGNKINNIMRIA